MVRCAASWCDVSSTESSAKFFRFPDEEDSRVDSWKDFAEIEGETTGLVLCSDHFAPCYLDKNGNITNIAIPTIWKKAADTESPEIVVPSTPEKLVFRVITTPTKDGERSDILSRENYLSDLLTSSCVSVEKKIAFSESKPVTSTPKPMHLLMGSTAIRGPPKLNSPSVGPARIIAGSKPRIVRINQDPPQSSRVKRTVSSPATPSSRTQIKRKGKDSSLLGEFLSFTKSEESDQGKQAGNTDDDDEVIEEQMEAEEEFVMEQDAEEEQIIEDDETMEVDTDVSNLTDHEKAVQPLKSPLAAGADNLDTSAASTPSKPSAKTPKSKTTKTVSVPSSATVVKVKGSADMPSVLNIDKVTKKRKAADYVRYRSMISASETAPNSDPKITPCRVELNIKPSDDVSKLTADLVLTPDVPKRAKELLQNTIELKSREEGRLLITRILSDHVCYRDVLLPILPSPIEVNVETTMLRSLAGKKLVKNPVVKIYPEHTGPTPFKAGNQKPVYATDIQLNETGLMTIHCCLVPISTQKKKMPPANKSPVKRGRPRKKVKQETPDTDEDEDVLMQLDDDDELEESAKPANIPEEINIQVPSYSGPISAEGPVLDLMRKKLREYFKSHPNISTIVVVPSDQNDILGNPEDDKVSSEDEEDSDIVAQTEEARCELRRTLSLAMKPPKRPTLTKLYSPYVPAVSCKRLVREELLAFSQNFSNVYSS